MQHENQRQRFHVVDLVALHFGPKLRERHLDDRDVLVFACYPATRADAVIFAVSGDVKIHALGGDARHAPDPTHIFQIVHTKPGLLAQLPPRGIGDIIILDKPCRDLKKFRRLCGQQDRCPQQPDKQGCTPRRIIGQHRNSCAMILDFPFDLAAVLKTKPHAQELAEALVQR